MGVGNNGLMNGGGQFGIRSAARAATLQSTPESHFSKRHMRHPRILILLTFTAVLTGCSSLKNPLSGLFGTGRNDPATGETEPASGRKSKRSAKKEAAQGNATIIAAKPRPERATGVFNPETGEIDWAPAGSGAATPVPRRR